MHNYELIRDFCGTTKGLKDAAILNADYSDINRETHEHNLSLIIVFPEAFIKFFPDREERLDRGNSMVNNDDNSHRSMVDTMLRVLKGERELMQNTAAVMLVTDTLYNEYSGLRDIADKMISENSSFVSVSNVSKVKNNDSEGFDIYRYAEVYNADYYDNQSGYIYLVQEYNQAIKLGLPTEGIRVIDPMLNTVVGVAERL